MESPYYALYHTSAELEPIFAQVFGGRLAFCGFEPIGPRKWIKETNCGFKYYFHLHPQHNGHAYLPCGAISIDFVPRIVSGKVRLQPKPKNVAVHHSFGRNIHPDWLIYKNREGFNERVNQIAGESVTEITTWFQRFASLNDVAMALDYEKANPHPIGFYNLPLTALAYAFVLARVRRFGEARSEFEKAIKSTFWDADLRSGLRNLFDAEIQRSLA